MPPAWVLIVCALISGASAVISSPKVHNVATTAQHKVVTSAKKTSHAVIHVVTLGNK